MSLRASEPGPIQTTFLSILAVGMFIAAGIGLVWCVLTAVRYMWEHPVL